MGGAAPHLPPTARTRPSRPHPLLFTPGQTWLLCRSVPTTSTAGPAHPVPPHPLQTRPRPLPAHPGSPFPAPKRLGQETSEQAPPLQDPTPPLQNRPRPLTTKPHPSLIGPMLPSWPSPNSLSTAPLHSLGPAHPRPVPAFPSIAPPLHEQAPPPTQGPAHSTVARPASHPNGLHSQGGPGPLGHPRELGCAPSCLHVSPRSSSPDPEGSPRKFW